MPRMARGHSDGIIFHALNRGNGRQELFHKDVDYKAFINHNGKYTGFDKSLLTSD
jgi:hypothetical protein